LSIGNVADFRQKNRKICEIPFNSTNKYQVGYGIVLNLAYIFAFDPVMFSNVDKVNQFFSD